MGGRTEPGVNALLVAGVTGCLVLLLSLAFSATARADVLFEHSTGVSAQSTPSQDFEPVNDAFDSEIADDFVVPAGKTWRIEEVFARGVKNGNNVANKANVIVYADNSGTPGAQILDELTTIKPDTYPRLELPIASQPALQAGTYWLGVQAIMPGSPDNSQWFWADNPAQSGSPAVFRNPGNGFVSGCTAFTARNTCNFGPNPANPEADQMFRLSGTEFSQVPDTTIDSGPADGSTITTDSTSFSFSSSDPESTFECRLDGGSPSACSPPTTLSGLSNGPHRFEVRATNGLGVGDPTPAASEFTVDTSPVGPSTACKSAKVQQKKALSKKKQAQKKLNKAKKKLKKAKKNRKLKAKAAKAVKAAKKKLGKSKRAVSKAKAKVKKTC